MAARLVSSNNETISLGSSDREGNDSLGNPVQLHKRAVGGVRRSLDFSYRRISCRVMAPGWNRWGCFTPPVVAWSKSTSSLSQQRTTEERQVDMLVSVVQPITWRRAVYGAICVRASIQRSFGQLMTWRRVVYGAVCLKAQSESEGFERQRYSPPVDIRAVCWAWAMRARLADHFREMSVDIR
jgi:hypothetical protein